MKIFATGVARKVRPLRHQKLVERRIDVRGVVHTPAKIEEAHQHEATETVAVDLTDARAVAIAVDGVGGVFLTTAAFYPDARTMALKVTARCDQCQCRQGRLRRRLSPFLSLPNHASTRPVEEALYASHLNFTVLQPAMYVQALEGTYHQALDTGRVVAPWSEHSKMTFVDYRDVAEVAALAFIDTRLSYGTFEPAGEPDSDRRNDESHRRTDIDRRGLRGDAPGLQRLSTMFADYDQHGFRRGNSIVLMVIRKRLPPSVADFISHLN